uniref:Unannotated protein n=1 Tax=freshwater metagenome TaxID=449393 RepID=A0A6J7PN14_9ZZZZ
MGSATRLCFRLSNFLVGDHSPSFGFFLALGFLDALLLELTHNSCLAFDKSSLLTSNPLKFSFAAFALGLAFFDALFFERLLFFGGELSNVANPRLLDFVKKTVHFDNFFRSFDTAFFRAMTNNLDFFQEGIHI